MQPAGRKVAGAAEEEGRPTAAVGRIVARVALVVAGAVDNLSAGGRGGPHEGAGHPVLGLVDAVVEVGVGIEAAVEAGGEVQPEEVGQQLASRGEGDLGGGATQVQGAHRVRTGAFKPAGQVVGRNPAVHTLLLPRDHAGLSVGEGEGAVVQHRPHLGQNSGAARTRGREGLRS